VSRLFAILNKFKKFMDDNSNKIYKQRNLEVLLSDGGEY
jgi:hypothetical protein